MQSVVFSFDHLRHSGYGMGSNLISTPGVDPVNARDPAGRSRVQLPLQPYCGGVGVAAGIGAATATAGMGAAIGITVGVDCYVRTFWICELVCKTPPPQPPSCNDLGSPPKDCTRRTLSNVMSPLIEYMQTSLMVAFTNSFWLFRGC